MMQLQSRSPLIPVAAFEQYEKGFRSRVDSGTSRFFEIFGASGERPLIVRCSGRAEGKGNHCDYNLCDAIGIGIGESTLVFIRRNSTGTLRIFSENFAEDDLRSYNIRDITKDTTTRWPNYALAVVRELQRASKLRGDAGFDVYVESTVPQTGGVSSSASFEVGLAHALCAVSGVEASPIELAALCQRAENSDLVESPCGLLDQASVALGGIVHLRFDRDPKDADFARPIPVDFAALGASFVIAVDPSSKRDLGTSGYPMRRAICQVAVTIFKEMWDTEHIESLRDVPERVISHGDAMIRVHAAEAFEQAIDFEKGTVSRERFPLLGDLMAKALERHLAAEIAASKPREQIIRELAALVPLRAMHIASEHRRVGEFLQAVANSDAVTIGKLFRESGLSGLNNYALDEGCPQLRTLIDLGAGNLLPGNFGMRNMGGGHSANVLSLVKNDLIPDFERTLLSAYRREYGPDAALQFIAFKPSPGVATVAI